MKITKLELENVKRVKALSLTPAPNGLTVIGGRNGQGKTSVLDAIAWALGGEKYRPSAPQRQGSVLPPRLHVVLDNGIVVDREGKNSALRVTDANGVRAGQALLDGLVEKLALDLPKFMNQTEKEKAGTLLRVIGVEDQLFQLDRQEQQLYNQRHALGQIADQKAKFAKEMPYFPGVPESPVSISELIAQQQDILARNGENQKKRHALTELAFQVNALEHDLKQLDEQMEALRQARQQKEAAYGKALQDMLTAQKTVSQLQDESTAELEESIQRIDETNRQVRANLDRERAEEEAKHIAGQYGQLTVDIEQVRQQKRELLQNAKLPLPGLTVEDGMLRYRGQGWDCMSGAEQLRVAVAIVRALNPNCEFVLLDKLEQMDTDTLRAFGDWLNQEGLQAICTRVSTGGECEIIIEDGEALTPPAAPEQAPSKQWTAGKF